MRDGAAWPATATAHADATSPEASAFDPNSVRWLGRVDVSDRAGPRFAWQGSGLAARLRATSIAARLRNDGGDLVFFQAVVDGRPARRVPVFGDVAQIVQLADDLAPGEHTLELYRETEGQFGATTFLGFVQGIVQGPTAPGARRIEVLGDSISAGYGNLGSEQHRDDQPSRGCTWSAENSSWYGSYAALAARALDAELTTIARSGWGILPSSVPEPNAGLPSVYENALGVTAVPRWHFRSPVHAVVINLGTNDWARGDPGAPFERAYRQFVQQVRSHHPEAWIFLTIGSMLAEPELTQVKSRLAAVVAALASAGDRKVGSFDLGTQDSRATGCDWHPSGADHQRMALILEAQLRQKLGW